MAKKIILFLSGLGQNASEAVYRCPDGQNVTGTQTNEAPVKYLLRKWPGVTELICVLTSGARKTAWENFRKSISKAAPRVQYREVSMEEREDFTKGPLSGILAEIRPGDEILLETTGGFRNAVMDLLLLSRVLSYTGVTVADAVYSNYQCKTIEDVSDMIRFFDLVGGMQELTSFGSVQRLQDYYRRKPGTPDPGVQKLMTAMNRLTEIITLCKTNLVDDCVEKFNTAMSEMDGCEDPLMRALLPAFREKFGNKLTIPGLIRWCTDNNMLQQALTIYREKLPGYLLDESRELVEFRGERPVPKIEVKKYMDLTSAQFVSGLMDMGARAQRTRSPWLMQHTKPGEVWENRVSMLENMRELLADSCFQIHCPVDQFCDIVMDYFFIHGLRNMVNHANEESGESEQLMAFLMENMHCKRPEDMTLDNIKIILNKSIQHLEPRGKKGKH